MYFLRHQVFITYQQYSSPYSLKNDTIYKNQNSKRQIQLLRIIKKIRTQAMVLIRQSTITIINC